MASTFPAKSLRWFAALLLSGAAAAGGAAWLTRAWQTDLPDDPLVLQSLAGTGQRDDALAQLRQQARDGAPVAMRALGLALAGRDGRLAEGIEWLEKAAAAGDNEARFSLGKLHMNGAPGLPADKTAALHWLNSAARAGHPGAAYHLGIAYRNGYGVGRDPAEAAKWFRQSAAANVPAALFMLANAYREGEGVPRDEAEALKRYEQAAELDHPEAIQTLAMAYRNGELGLPRDEASHRHYVAETAHALKHPALVP